MMKAIKITTRSEKEVINGRLGTHTAAGQLGFSIETDKKSEEMIAITLNQSEARYLAEHLQKLIDANWTDDTDGVPVDGHYELTS